MPFASGAPLLPEPARGIGACAIERRVKRWAWPQIGALSASLAAQAVHASLVDVLPRGIRLTLFFAYILLSIAFCTLFCMCTVWGNVRWPVVRPFFGQPRLLYLAALVATFFIATSTHCLADCDAFWTPVTLAFAIGRGSGFFCFLLTVSVDCLWHRPPRPAVVALYALHMAFCAAEFVLATTGVFEERALIRLSGSSEIGINKLLSIVTSQFLVLLASGLVSAWSDRTQQYYYLVDNIDPVPRSATPKTRLTSLASAARYKLSGARGQSRMATEGGEQSLRCPCCPEADALAIDQL